MKKRTYTEIVRAYAKLSDYLIDIGMQPIFQILDNEASQALQREIRTRNYDFQLVPPHMHRRNTVERAIRTFKNHFVSGLCSSHEEFQMQLWCRLLPQATLTLNLLQIYRLNIRKSAEEQLNVTFNFNIVPLAPPGKKIIVHEKPSQRPTWAPHSVNGWYLGPAPIHYRCHTTYITET